MLKYPYHTFFDRVKPFMTNINGQVQEYSDNDSEIPYVCSKKVFYNYAHI